MVIGNDQDNALAPQSPYAFGHAGDRLGWRRLSTQAQGSPALRGSQSPRAPMRSSRRARQGALPLPRRTFDGSPNGRRQGAHRRGPAATLGDGPPAFKEREEVAAGVQRNRGSHLRPHDAHARVLVSKPL